MRVGYVSSPHEGVTFPMEVFAPHESQARCNHSQTLARLNERGGLSWGEALAVLEDRPWTAMEGSEARVAVVAFFDAWRAGRTKETP